MQPKPPPDFSIPAGTTSVTVSAIDTTTWIHGCPCKYMWDPPISGFDRVRCGCWSFLITHPTGRKLLYDLGVRKDWENLPPGCGIKEYMDSGIMQELRADKDVPEILTEGGIDVTGGAIEGVIWSHFHFDHTGDMSRFPGSTKLIVGSGTKSNFMPGYPADPEAQTLETDSEGREVMEIDFGNELWVGAFKAYDYFGDGSFYILDSPGHAIGHINALARTKVEPAEFVHLCGDSAHHCGEIRPSVYQPLPEKITPSPVPAIHADACPSEVFHAILRNDTKTEHILELMDPMAGKHAEQKYALIYNDDQLRGTIREVEGFDAREDVFTVLAHDWSLKGVIDEWPGTLNDWKEKKWKSDTRWKFLEDFKGVIKE